VVWKLKEIFIMVSNNSTKKESHNARGGSGDQHNKQGSQGSKNQGSHQESSSKGGASQSPKSDSQKIKNN
jgi:hypothetical protein